MIIPHGKLSPGALAGVIEEYVTRDGTELGDATDKANAVIRLLEHGELVLVYDPSAESCNILTRDQLANREGSG